MRVTFLSLSLLCLVSGSLWAAVQPLATKPAPATSLPEQAAPALTDPYSKSLEHLVKGELDAAEKGFKELRQTEPKVARAVLGLAEVSFRRKQFKAGEDYLNEALRLEPGNYHVHSSLGRYNAANGNLQQAEKYFAEAVRVAPKEVAPRMDLADLFISRLNRPKEALVEYDKVLEIKSDHAGAHYARGVAYLKLGYKEKAAQDFEAASRLEPLNPIPMEALALLYAQQKKYDQALLITDRILTEAPNLARTRVVRSEILAARGDSKGALRELESVVKNAPTNVEYRLRLAMALHAYGNLDDALASYRKAMEMDSKSALAHNNGAAILLQKKSSLDQAEQWARKAVELEDKSGDYRETLGQVLLQRGNTDEALRQFAKAKALAPRDAPLLTGIGLALADKGVNGAAREYLSSALAVSGTFEGAEKAKKVLQSLPK